MPPDPVPAFPGLGALKAAHVSFLDQKGRSATDIRAFIAKARATGGRIEGAGDRREGQRVLDFWSSELLGQRDITAEDFNPAILDPFGTGGPEPEARDGALSLAGASANAREIIRLGALARQWQSSGAAAGYLLQGDALRNAARLADSDRDIASFVAASEAAEQTRHRREARTRRLVIAALSVLCLLTTAAALFSWQQWQAARQANAGLAQANATLGREKADLQALIAGSVVREAQFSDEIARLKAEVAALSETLRAAEEEGTLDTAPLTPELRRTIENASPQPSDVIAEAPPDALHGYRPDFLGPNLPLPTLGSPLVPLAANGGAPLSYVNAGLVLNAARRLPFYAAVMLDRRAARAPSADGAFSFDPRLPAALQADPDWFVPAEIVQGQLVRGADIAWGDFFAGDPIEADRRATGLSALYTNAIPQYDWFNRGPWAALDDWVALSHNPVAQRVVILSGPILTAQDPVAYGVTLPSGFWKIAISRGASGGLVVDAFVLWQTETAPRQFDPAANRATLEEIESLSGLLLPGPLYGIEAGADPDPPTPGQEIAARLSDLVSGDTAAAMAMLDTLNAAFAPDGLGMQERLNVAQALVALAAGTLPQPPTASASDAVITALAMIPSQDWLGPEAAGLRARARVALAGRPDAPANTGAVPESLLSALGFGASAAPKVTIRFAATPRAEAQALAATLVRLGWTVSGIERTGDGPARSEIHAVQGVDGPPPPPAAAGLAADLEALGFAASVVDRPADTDPGRLDLILP